MATRKQNKNTKFKEFEKGTLVCKKSQDLMEWARQQFNLCDDDRPPYVPIVSVKDGCGIGIVIKYREAKNERHQASTITITDLFDEVEIYWLADKIITKEWVLDIIRADDDRIDLNEESIARKEENK